MLSRQHRAQIRANDRLDGRLPVTFVQAFLKLGQARVVQYLGAPQQNRVEQFALRTEIVVWQRDIDTRMLCDRTQRHTVIAVFGKLLFCGIENSGSPIKPGFCPGHTHIGYLDSGAPEINDTKTIERLYITQHSLAFLKFLGQFQHLLKNEKNVQKDVKGRNVSHYSMPQALFPDVFRLHGRSRPTREAMICGQTRYDWRTFNNRLNQVANAALAENLKPGDRVIVLMANGTEMIETLFGLIKASLASVPINLSVTDEAIIGMIRDADARMIICTEDQAQRIEANSHLHAECDHMVRISTGRLSGWRPYADWSSDTAKSEPDVQIAPDTLLNIIYSSGTTGTPKGIAHTQQGRRDWAGDLAIALRYHGAARTLVTIGLYSNISWVILLCTALAGGTLIIEPGFDAPRFWDLCEAERITHSSMVPLQMQMILDAEPTRGPKTSIQAIMTAGSPLYPDLKRRLFDRFGPSIIELYGLTEGVITTLDPEVASERLASVGQPLLGTDLRIVDNQDHEVPTGTAGEIVATGRIVMPGYWRREEATIEASWTAPDGSIWLRTGDIGRLDEDGFLYIVDRKKDMILSGGQNVYPQDIEAQLVQHESISEAAVIGVRSRRWGETPLALVVLRTPVEPTEIREWCNARVGKQQRVADVKVLPALPRNPNGKILKRELRKTFEEAIYD